MSQELVVARKKEAFLVSLRQHGSVKKAAFAAGYQDSSFIRKLRKTDEDFSAEWDEALLVAVDDVLLPEAQRRAVEGTQEPVFHKGEIVGWKQRYSDQLMMFLVRGAMPEKYGTHVKADVDLTGTFGIAAIPIQAKTVEDWELDAQNVTQQQKILTLKADEFERVPTEEPDSDEDVLAMILG